LRSNPTWRRQLAGKAASGEFVPVGKARIPTRTVFRKRNSNKVWIGALSPAK
jgi:hypothetical protein